MKTTAFIAANQLTFSTANPAVEVPKVSPPPTNWDFLGGQNHFLDFDLGFSGNAGKGTESFKMFLLLVESSCIGSLPIVTLQSNYDTVTHLKEVAAKCLDTFNSSHQLTSFCVPLTLRWPVLLKFQMTVWLWLSSVTLKFLEPPIKTHYFLQLGVSANRLRRCNYGLQTFLSCNLSLGHG